MQTSDFIIEIGKYIPMEESAQVLTALRQDTLVWESLQQESFIRAALAGAGHQAEWWSPGRLAMLALGVSWPETLTMEKLFPIDAALQEKALRVFQKVQRTATMPASLADAGLLALALRERRRLTGAWNGLLQEILPKPDRAEGVYPVWRTPLACLYAMIPDPEEMLFELAPKTMLRAPLDWIAHTLIAQPLSLLEQTQVLSRVLPRLPVSIQLGVLRSLNLHGAEDLARSAAGFMLPGNPAFADLRAQSGIDGPDLAGLSARALTLHQMGAFYQLAGDPDQARALYESAESALGQWSAGLKLQRLSLAADEESCEQLLQEGQWLTHLSGSPNWLKNELAMALVNSPVAPSGIERITGQEGSAFFQIREAQARFGSEPAVARDLAHQAAQKIIADTRQRGLPFTGEYVLGWKPGVIISSFLDLGLPEEALNLIDAFLEARPVDIELLNQAGKILEESGQIERAVRVAQQVVALSPEQTAWRRILAARYGKHGEWETAFKEWQHVLALSENHGLDDRLSCGQAALKAGYVSEAVQISQIILADDANNGAAMGLLGQALIQQGERHQALTYLVQATLLEPESLPTWLALAQLQTELGESQRALETLRAAVTAVPEAYEGHLELGRACFAAGLLAEALPHLKKAFHLAKDNGVVALYYGRALRVLGHSGEARQILERTRPAWKAQPELAYEYAQVLLDMNDADGALPVLEMALNHGLPVLDGYLLYAKILLGEYQTGKEMWESEIALGRMQQADQALRRILEIDPDSLEARFLMADILREKGELDEALELYRALAELPAASASELRWRVQWGLGRTAMRLGQTETALAAIKEAVQTKPDSIKLQRGLAEASLRAELTDEALEAARAALQLAPDDMENLAWFAGFTTRLGEIDLAVEMLERAVQIAPHRADLRVNLAECQMSAGDLTAARESLDSVRGMDGAGKSVLRQAGQIFMRMEDPCAALDCFNRALADDSPSPSDLLFEVSCLYEKMGDLESALELSQKALEEHPDNLPVYLFQADLLGRLGRPQAALALLEKALRMAQVGQENDTPEGQFLGEIHQRFSALFMTEGDLAAALYHAEVALAQDPERADLAYHTADLALALLQIDYAGRILAQTMPDGTASAKDLLKTHGREGVDLLCLKVEFALDYHKADNVWELVEIGLSHAPGSARLLAARARLFAGQKDFQAAQQAYAMARQTAQEQPDHNSNKRRLWLARAAMELQYWQESLNLFMDYLQNHPGEARAHLELARALVLAAEQQGLCATVGCRTHAPGLQMLDEEHQIRFNEAIHAAGVLVKASEVTRWQTRGSAVFMPSTQTARALATMLAVEDDAAALVAALRQVNNRAAAAQIGQRHAGNAGVLIQLALCFQGKDASEGLLIAEKAVQINPRDPLAQAALGSLALQAGEVDKALQAYATALQTWADEPEWHDAAGDLCMQADFLGQGIFHRRQAVALAPEQALYAYKLGQACLSQADASEAIEYLEKATALDPHLIEVWLVLATAYQAVGLYPQALEAAKQACSLNPSAVEALLVAGEISLAMNQADPALEYAQKAVRSEPGNPAAFLFLSNVWVMKGRPIEGLEVLERSGPEVKANFPVAFERARLIYQVHGPQAALDGLEKLALDHPEDPNLLGFLARVQAECGEVKLAERTAFKALRLDPDQPELALMLGRLQRKTGQLDQAVYLLGEVIRLAPDRLDAYLELASVYQERREYAQALEIYQQIMRIAPNDYRAYYHSGLILRDNKDYSGAETMLRRAADRAPDNLSIRRQLVAVIALNLIHSKQEVTVQ